MWGGAETGHFQQTPGLPLLRRRGHGPLRGLRILGPTGKRHFILGHDTKHYKPKGELVFFMSHNEPYYPNFIMVLWKEGLGVVVVKYFHSGWRWIGRVFLPSERCSFRTAG